MNPFVRLVALREITTRVRDKGFLISTAFLLVIVGASVLVPLAIDRFSGRDEFTVATVGTTAATVVVDAGRLGDAAFAAAGTPAGGGGVPDADVSGRAVGDVAAAEAAVRDGDADAALVPADSTADGTADVVLVGDSSVPSALTDLVTRALTQTRLDDVLTGAGVDPASVAFALDGAAPAQRLLDTTADRRDVAIGVGYVFALLFFFTVFTFGMQIASSVTEEKQSRIVELLVTAVPVRALLLGKVLGNTALALGQVTVLLAVGLAGASIAGQSDVVTLLLRASGWFVLFFVLGFVMLACLWAAAGALASRQEELQSTTMPLQLVVMGPFFASVYILEPGRWMTLLSYVPFTAPLMMPRRIALGDAAWWEILASAGVVVVTALAIVAVGARIYERSLLQTSAKVGWRTAWRAPA